MRQSVKYCCRKPYIKNITCGVSLNFLRDWSKLKKYLVQQHYFVGNGALMLPVMARVASLIYYSNTLEFIRYFHSVSGHPCRAGLTKVVYGNLILARSWFSRETNAGREFK